MPDVHLGERYGVVTVAGRYEPGDPPPSGYLDWHEWAAAQHKAGLRQKQCGRGFAAKLKRSGQFGRSRRGFAAIGEL